MTCKVRGHSKGVAEPAIALYNLTTVPIDRMPWWPLIRLGYETIQGLSVDSDQWGRRYEGIFCLKSNPKKSLPQIHMNSMDSRFYYDRRLTDFGSETCNENASTLLHRKAIQ